MLRLLLSALLIVGPWAYDASGQDWAKELFKVLTHDFGSVARNAKSEFAFELENPYAVDVHIANVRASCGCTTPKITKQTLTTYEKGSILTTYNTDRFLGKRGATVTVTFDQPRYTEVQLIVTGYIRSDVVVEPGGISFGSVDQGEIVERTSRVRYMGHENWNLLGIQGGSKHVDVELRRLLQSNGRPAFDVLVRLKESAPVGYFSEQLTLTTNDRNAPTLPLIVEGRILGPIVVSPDSLFLGVVQPGQKVTKQLIVRGKQPFRIVSIKEHDAAFEYGLTEEAKKLHVIPVTFTAGEDSRKVVEAIHLETDMGEGFTVRCTASAAIVEAVASN